MFSPALKKGSIEMLVLALVESRPRHGYEIIKALEERFGGMYSPSAGTVYPTLTLLEDLGYARVTVEESGKKIYSITDEGRAYLSNNRSAVAVSTSPRTRMPIESGSATKVSMRNSSSSKWVPLRSCVSLLAQRSVPNAVVAPFSGARYRLNG